MSSFFMPSIAFMARGALAGSGSGSPRLPVVEVNVNVQGVREERR